MLKYIGEFEKLKDYGFELIENEEWVKYEIKEINKNLKVCFRAIRILNEESDRIIYMSHEGLVDHKGVINDLDLNFELVQDLIKDGLVEKVDK